MLPATSAPYFGLSVVATRPIIAAFPSDGPLYFFLDFMNIAAGAHGVAESRDSAFSARYVRIHAHNLRSLVQASRHWKSGYGAAALWGPNDALRWNFRAAGIDLRVYEPGRNSGSEQGVDEIIQGEMRKLLARGTERGVVALATGDGNGHVVGEGFIPTLRDLHDAGFLIEIYSWRGCLSGALRRWVEEHKGRVFELDTWFGNITFVEGGRVAKPLGLKRPRY